MQIFRPLIVLVLGLCAAAQTFEVASIKPNAANDNRISIGIQPGGRFIATGITLKLLIGQAYDVRDFQITNAPGWAGSDRYDINAKADAAGERIPPDQLRPMLRALLEERFQLKVHKETKEMPVYALVVGKSGPKLKPTTAEPGDPSRAARGPGGLSRPGMIRMGRGQLNLTGGTIAMLARQLSSQLGRPVIDKTGLDGEYDITLEWTPEPGHGGGPFGGPPPHPEAPPRPGGDGPTIYTAVQEQLGLRLESAKGPVVTIVIDAVSKPSDN